MPVLLGETMTRFHSGLAERAKRQENFQFHYVTARELANLALAAEAGWTGPVSGALDFAISHDYGVSSAAGNGFFASTIQNNPGRSN